MTHAPLSEQALAEAGIKPNLVRLSVGLESTEDLLSDILQALRAARSAGAIAPVGPAAIG